MVVQSLSTGGRGRNKAYRPCSSSAVLRRDAAAERRGEAQGAAISVRFRLRGLRGGRRLEVGAVRGSPDEPEVGLGLPKKAANVRRP